ncbi:MAG: hypothetical protein HRO68_10200 [Nitrosopumilus sp.]|nr:hypothetical protein [Nitrosopumilus sp.]
MDFTLSQNTGIELVTSNNLKSRHKDNFIIHPFRIEAKDLEINFNAQSNVITKILQSCIHDKNNNQVNEKIF